MTSIIVHADCSHSPKKRLLRDLNIAFAQSDVDGILGLCDVRRFASGQK